MDQPLDLWNIRQDHPLREYLPMIPHATRTQSTVNADRWRLKSRRFGKFRKFNMKYTCGNMVLTKFLLLGSSALVPYMPLSPARSPREGEFMHYGSP